MKINDLEFPKAYNGWIIIDELRILVKHDLFVVFDSIFSFIDYLLTLYSVQQTVLRPLSMLFKKLLHKLNILVHCVLPEKISIITINTFMVMFCMLSLSTGQCPVNASLVTFSAFVLAQSISQYQLLGRLKFRCLHIKGLTTTYLYVL